MTTAVDETLEKNREHRMLLETELEKTFRYGMRTRLPYEAPSPPPFCMAHLKFLARFPELKVDNVCLAPSLLADGSH